MLGVQDRISRTDTLSNVNDTFYTQLLQEWPYEPGKLSARLVQDSYGTSRGQVRVQLGILQMELSGRPDGVASIFESLRQSDFTSGSSVLDADHCRELHHEAAMYAYRALVCSSLELYDQVVSDASRNLAVMDFMIAHSSENSARRAALNLRVQLLMMRVRAQASQALSSDDRSLARTVLEEGVHQVKQSLQATGFTDDLEAAAEIKFLRSMMDVLIPKLPSSQRHEMELRLKAAIEVENYELAAILTNELRQLF